MRGAGGEASPAVPDCAGPGLRVLFVGINPGTHSGASGHHFAGPSNLFWRLLHEAGLTPTRLRPQDDRSLPALGLGLTNLVERVTPGADALSWAEMRAGGERLRANVAAWRPRVVCLLGKDVYRAYAGLPRSAPVAWGPQSRPVVPGVLDFVAPNPSGRSTVPYAERLAWLRRLAELAGAPGPAGSGRVRAPVRLVVCDIEGCLVPGGPQPWPLPALAEVARRAPAGEEGRGPRLTLCSGRPAQFVEAVARVLGLRLPVLCENGAVLLDPATGRARALYTSAQARLMARVRRLCLRLFERPGEARVPPGRELGVSLVPADAAADLPALRERVAAALAGAGVDPAALHVTYSGGAVDVTPAGVDKGSGLRRLLAELGVEPAAVLAIGDGANDLPMLTLAGWRGAPANARPEVRAAVDRVAARPLTEGVLELIDWAVGATGPGAGRQDAAAPDPAGRLPTAQAGAASTSPRSAGSSATSTRTW